MFLELLQSNSIQDNFTPRMQESTSYNVCSICEEVNFLSNSKMHKNGKCSRCTREWVVNRFSHVNGMIPDDIPPQLKGLTFLGEMLICKILPHIYIV